MTTLPGPTLNHLRFKQHQHGPVLFCSAAGYSRRPEGVPEGGGLEALPHSPAVGEALRALEAGERRGRAAGAEQPAGTRPGHGPGAGAGTPRSPPATPRAGSHLPRRLQSVKYTEDTNFSTRSSAVRRCFNMAPAAMPGTPPTAPAPSSSSRL